MSAGVMAEQKIQTGGIEIATDTFIVSGDLVARDKIVQNIDHIINNITERPLTEAEQADRARAIAIEHLRQGVMTYIERLRDRVTSSAVTSGPYKGLLE